MKVKCINKSDWLYITIGKTYEVIDEDKYSYKIINDYGTEARYWKTYFKTLSEIRNKKIDKLLEL